MSDSKNYEANLSAGKGMKNLLNDPLSLATKPAVIFKFAAAILSLVIYSCISSAWYDGKCLFNKHNGICRFGSLALISFLACVALLVLEIMFDHISSLKVRRRIAIGDVIFSGINSVFFLLLFVFLSIAWLKSDYPPFGHSINCCRIAILLSFLAIFAMAGGAGFAYVRYQSGLEMMQFMTEEQLAAEQAQCYNEQGQYQQQDGMSTNYPLDSTQQYSSGQYTSYGFDSDIPQR